MIRMSNVTKKYGHCIALRDVSLNVLKNDVYGLLGHNGAGKSTTFEILSGLVQADKGAISIENGALDSLGYLPEMPQFYTWMTPVEYLEYIGCDYGRNVRKRIYEVLDIVGLETEGKRRIKGYSRGMRQRLGLACAIFYNPDILLLDEPTSALDPLGRKEILNLISQLKTFNKTILLSTHILEDVEKVCNRVGVIKEGVTVKEMEMTELMTNHIEPGYEIVFKEPPSSYDIIDINKQQWVTDVKVEQLKMLIHTLNREDIGQAVFGLISKLKTPVQSVELKRHSLEDVYLMLTS